MIFSVIGTENLFHIYWHFRITDRNGNIVVDIPYDLLPSKDEDNGVLTWTWNQTYEIYTYAAFFLSNGSLPQNGDQVSPGKYQAWLINPITGTNYATVVFKILEYPELVDDELSFILDHMITDKNTYCVGEPVNITMGYYLSGSSTAFERGYVIKDEDGNWVRDITLTTCDIRIENGYITYTWDQTYSLRGESDWHGKPKVHFQKNGEQVSPGKYYIYSLIVGRVSPVEIEIVDCSPVFNWNITSGEVITDKEKYNVGEPIIITYNGWHDPGFPHKEHFYITDGDGKWVFEYIPIAEPCVVDPQCGAVSITWNQTYQLYDSYFQLESNSGKQVPPGKYHVYYGVYGHAEFEIVDHLQEVEQDLPALVGLEVIINFFELLFVS
jgi:hypothetical protein